jgi:hypothetical protein
MKSKFIMDNLSFPSFQRRQESSDTKSPRSGQYLGVDLLRKIFSQLDSRLRGNDEKMNYPGSSQ